MQRSRVVTRVFVLCEGLYHAPPKLLEFAQMPSPPVRISGDPILDWIILIGVAGLVCYWLRAAFLARESIGFVSKNLAHAGIVFLLTLFILGTVGQGSIPRVQQVPFAGLIAIVFLIVQQSKKRSRHIPGSIRKAVIARDLKGARFNSRKHHIDHVWPFSLGGSHSLDNLRVIDKSKNLKKGAKRPRFRDMW